MGLFVTCGFPAPDATMPILRALAASGADFIELGMPFSDPMAEGGPIQRSSEIALKNGITMRDVLETAESYRASGESAPLLLMGYANPVLQYGLDNFCRDAKSSGVEGMIIPDLPPEEADELAERASSNGLDLIFLVAPNTSDDRMTYVDERASGFVYAVSLTGLTGSGLASTEAVETYLARARRNVVRNPLLVGFGIRTSEEARRLSANTDGFIVGSALITEIERLWSDAGIDDVTRVRALQAFATNLHPQPDKTAIE